jgi:peptide-methionine (R)-S-oxide reductase
MKLFAALALLAALLAPHPISNLVRAKADQSFPVTKPDAVWKKTLSNNAYLVLRKSGTEKPYTGKYWDNHEKGIFVCAGCGQKLFSSDAKFDSHTGWPSFFREIAKGKTLIREDHSDGLDRTEVICARCGGHLGHVFEDGPAPTGLRYCMNSPALVLKSAQ